MQICNLEGQGSNPLGAEWMNGAEVGEGGTDGGDEAVGGGGGFDKVGDFLEGEERK